MSAQRRATGGAGDADPERTLFYFLADKLVAVASPDGSGTAGATGSGIASKSSTAEA